MPRRVFQVLAELKERAEKSERKVRKLKKQLDRSQKILVLACRIIGRASKRRVSDSFPSEQLLATSGFSRFSPDVLDVLRSIEGGIEKLLRVEPQIRGDQASRLEKMVVEQSKMLTEGLDDLAGRLNQSRRVYTADRPPTAFKEPETISLPSEGATRSATPSENDELGDRFAGLVTKVGRTSTEGGPAMLEEPITIGADAPTKIGMIGTQRGIAEELMARLSFMSTKEATDTHSTFSEGRGEREEAKHVQKEFLDQAWKEKEAEIAKRKRAEKGEQDSDESQTEQDRENESDGDTM